MQSLLIKTNKQILLQFEIELNLLKNFKLICLELSQKKDLNKYISNAYFSKFS